MELFDEKGCLTPQALAALNEGRLDELGRLEAAEHLAYCDRCMDRYTLLLAEQHLETPERPLGRAVRQSLWVRAMQTRLGRVTVACAAAVLALGLWSVSRELPLTPPAALPPERPVLTAPASYGFLEDAKEPRDAPAAQARETAAALLNRLKVTIGGFDHEQ